MSNETHHNNDNHHKHNNNSHDYHESVSHLGLPMTVVEPSLVMYRSTGIGLFGVCMRFLGMPLEKLALYMNSSQVSGKGQFQQAMKLTFQEGPMAPYRVVGMSSLTAWFLQYSVMGFAFQFFDHGLSQLMGVQPVYYGNELMEPRKEEEDGDRGSLDVRMKTLVKNVLSPVLAASFESKVSNRAEVQRFFGPEKFMQIERTLNANALSKAAGPAFVPSAMRNIIMCQTTFLLTPITYKLYFPQERKSNTTLFWYGLTMNIFVGNVAAITQQALWGRSLDYLSQRGHISYQHVIQEGLQKEGFKAFFTTSKWFSRVLMNAPAQGVLPWFYNDVLPLGEPFLLRFVQSFIYEPFLQELKEVSMVANATATAAATATATATATTTTAANTTQSPFVASSPR